MTNNTNRNLPPLWASATPIIALLIALTWIIINNGADSVQTLGPWALLGAAALSLIVTKISSKPTAEGLKFGLKNSFRQVLPSLPILLLIGTVSSTWMLSGVVPLMIEYGMHVLSPDFFLVTACAVSALISVLTGSSWTTIATIGVAFMGIGLAMGFSPGWIAGAIISGAYFGDKISPLSDTTVLASSSCNVELFSHIRYMMITTIPSMVIALAVFATVGLCTTHTSAATENELCRTLADNFNLTPWILFVPIATAILIAFRVNTYITLAGSSLLGLIAMLAFQSQVMEALLDTAPGSLQAADYIRASATTLFTSTQLNTSSELLDSLVATGGMAGMLPTVWLVSCAMIFGGIMIGTGMLATITHALTRRLKSARSMVSATVGSGLALNGFTGDQYLSIIISSNIYRPMYEQIHLERRLLSRTVEDSISVTSVLIPWNSCGLTQSTVLGVSTMTYLPYCIFNIISPIMSLFIAWAGIKIKRTIPISASANTNNTK